MQILHTLMTYPIVNTPMSIGVRTITVFSGVCPWKAICIIMRRSLLISSWLLSLFVLLSGHFRIHSNGSHAVECVLRCIFSFVAHSPGLMYSIHSPDGHGPDEQLMTYSCAGNIPWYFVIQKGTTPFTLFVLSVLRALRLRWTVWWPCMNSTST